MIAALVRDFLRGRELVPIERTRHEYRNQWASS